MLCEKVQIITLRIVSKLSDIKWGFFQVFYIQYQNDLNSIPSDNILDFRMSQAKLTNSYRKSVQIRDELYL